MAKPQSTPVALSMGWYISLGGFRVNVVPAFSLPPPVGNAPMILYTDFTAGPTSGGENNLGAYLSIFGLNLGNFSDYGVTNFVTIGGVNVDNYRCLEASVAPHLAAYGVKRIVVQVGALTGLSAGTAYPISVTVGGVGPSNATSGGNFVDLDGVALTFIPQPGNIYFVDFLNGNNANPGTFASPFKDMQTSAGTGGAMHINTTANGTNGIHPGSHVYMRDAGSFTAAGQNSRWVNLDRITGRPATGATDRGPICVSSYPGAAGANAPEHAVWNAPAGAGGAFNGNSSARSTEVSTSYGGFTGWCQDLQFANMHVISSPTAASDGSPFNLQNKAQRWRIVNNEIEWRSTVTGASHAKGAGISDEGIDCWEYGNYIHDIYGDASANENHGIYHDGANVGTSGMTIAYNYVKDVTAGNTVQFFNSANSSSGFIVHHNWLENANKHGVNCADGTVSAVFYDNVIVTPGESGFRTNACEPTVTNGVYFFNNVIYGWGRVVSSRYAIQDDGSWTGGGCGRFENNICMQYASHAANSYGFASITSNSSVNGIVLFKDRWYDPDGRLTTKPSQDSTGSYGNPSFTSATGHDFTLANGSACIDAGNTPLVARTTGYNFSAAPLGAAHDQGAFERAP